MFRLQESNLPEDPKFPADLKDLGFFINEAGQFRMIDYPDKDFQYHYSNNERVNEVRREAYQICQRNEVARRLEALGLEKLYLPQLTSVKPEHAASVPILAPPAEILRTRKRVIVVVNDALQDLGILAYRRLQRELGVNGGSVTNFAKELIKRSTPAKDDFDIFKDGAGVENKAEETPGLIVMNCGQLLYSYKFGEAKSVRSWTAMPRKSSCHDSIKITEDNHIDGNREAKEHIQFVLENVINNKNFVAEDAEVYVVGIEDGAENLLFILDENLEKYGSRLTAMALINPRVACGQIHNPTLKALLHQRARQWRVESFSNNPRQCIEMPSQYFRELEMIDGISKDKPTTLAQGTDGVKTISWLETVSSGGLVSNVLAAVSDQLKRLALSTASVQDKLGAAEAADDRDDLDAICPTFPDDDNPWGAGECIFTSPKVQDCVLQFFEEVAQDPAHFHNPMFSTVPTSMPVGSKDDADYELENAAYLPSHTPVMSPAEQELNEKKAELENMKAALRDTPDTAELHIGRLSLEKRVRNVEAEVRALSKKALATGGLKAGEAEELRKEMGKGKKWEPTTGGPKIMFAGTMVDSELVKAAGMAEFVEEELAALDNAVNGQASVS